MLYSKTLKFFSILLTALLLIACSPAAQKPQDSATEQNTETEEPEQLPQDSEADETVYRYSGDPDYPILAETYLSDLPDRYFGGTTFFITSPDTTLFDENEIHYVSDVVSKRNTAVEEKYNISIESAKSDASVILEEAKKSALAGMYYTDIMCIPFEEVGTFESEGLLMNLRSLPHLDLTQPYFNKYSVNALSAGYKIYGVAGEATPVSNLPCVIYNKNLAEDLGITDLYNVAINGEFTWDKLFAYMDLCVSSEGITGAVLNGGESYDYIFTSCGQSFISSNEKKVPSIGVADYSMNYPTTYARTLLASGEKIGVNKDTAMDAFNNGKALFTIGNVGDLDEYRNSDVLVGILPMPKTDADSEYLSLAGENALIMTIPHGTTNSEMTSLVLSALNAASYGYITEENASYLHATTLPDNRSADVLEMISRSAVYDFSTAFEKTVPVLAELKEAIRVAIETKDLTSFYAVAPNVDSTLASLFPLSN